eukprot:1830935-Amphidinium_carterae.1
MHVTAVGHVVETVGERGEKGNTSPARSFSPHFILFAAHTLWRGSFTGGSDQRRICANKGTFGSCLVFPVAQLVAMHLWVCSMPTVTMIARMMTMMVMNDDTMML